VPDATTGNAPGCRHRRRIGHDRRPARKRAIQAHAANRQDHAAARGCELVSLLLVHVVAPAAEDITPNNDTNDIADTAMRIILLMISFLRRHAPRQIWKAW
jgi:hypothetical protein